ELYQQSLQLQEQIGNVKGKAATLHAMANIYVQQGQVSEALELYQQSLQLQEQIGNVKGKAATLANMAYLARREGDATTEFQLYRQAAESLAQIGAFPDLVTVLGNLGVASGSDFPEVYLAQAVWLSLRIEIQPSDQIATMAALFQKIPRGDELEALLATTAMFLTARANQPSDSDTEQLSNLALRLISTAAQHQGIENEAEFQTWFEQQQLNDPSHFLLKLNQALEALIGDKWLFDRAPFTPNT
ncbi:MAG: tetratricopeptide repeat protein, partial [Cyanobacteria bacterium J06642_2]